MAQFITRVELQGSPSEQDYERLHSAMQAVGFGRAIKGDDGKAYKLPTATYVSIGDFTASTVRDLASAAAKNTGLRYLVLTARVDDVAWQLNEALNPHATLLGERNYLNPLAWAMLGGTSTVRR